MEEEIDDDGLFDHEDVFDKQIYPLLKSIIRICDEHDIPFLTVVQFANDEEGPKVSTSVVFPKERTASSLVDFYKSLTEGQ